MNTPNHPSGPAAGVVIVNDSAVARAVTAAVLAADGGCRLLGQATGGRAGVELVCRLRPHLVLLDMHMPDLDGVEVTRRIMATCPTRILICSATIRSNTGYLFNALKHGALDYTHTPVLAARPGESVTREALLTAGAGLLRKVRTVLGLATPMATPAAVQALPAATRRTPERADGWGDGPAPGSAPGPSPRPAPRPAPSSAPSSTQGPAPDWPRVRVVAIGSSTGGPSALAALFGALPRGLPAIYLVSQHIDPEFTDGLAQWLAEETGHPVAVARHGETPLPGHVYLARGGRANLLLTPAGRLLYEPAGEAIYCPNINRLFASVAATVPAADVPAAGVNPTSVSPDGPGAPAPICGVVLTGLGDDGCDGLAAIKAVGGRVLTQDPATAVVDGMPGAPIRRGIVAQGFALPDLARLIAHWIGAAGGAR